MEVEEEVMDLTSDSGTDESEDEILNKRESVVDRLVTFIWGEGCTQDAQELKKDVKYFEALVKNVATVAKRNGIKKTEARWRSRRELEEDGTEKMREGVKAVVREEIDAGLRRFEIQRDGSKMADWLLWRTDLGEDFDEALEEW